jgi:hypothetical protein
VLARAFSLLYDSQEQENRVAKVKLDPDVTIRDVLPTLKKPEDYVCGILEKLYGFRRQHPQVAVRIGVTSRAIPYYRIVHSAEVGTPDRDDQILGTYLDNHKPLEGAASEAMNGHWSSRFMTFEEVQDLRGQIPPRHARRS